jgi:RNA recognition motif-containing protein
MAAAIETKLYVTNFPSSATRQQLQQFFSRFGRVQECASKEIKSLIFGIWSNSI